MAQHDYVIANQGFPAFRSDLNDALAAVVSNNSGATEPTTMFAHQIWVDTAADPSILKIRNADNDAWITIGTIDQTGDKFNLTCANATLAENLTLNAQGDLRFADADSSHYVGFQAPTTVAADVLWTLPSVDGTSGQVLSTDGSGALSWASGGNSIAEGNSNVTVTDAGTGKIEFSVDGVEVADFTTSLIVFNQTGANQDFRVEGDTNANLFVVDASADSIGIGTNAPSALLDLSATDSATIRFSSTDTTSANNQDIGVIEFAGSDTSNDGVRAKITGTYAGTAGQSRLQFYTQNTGASSPVEQFRIDNISQLWATIQSEVGTDYTTIYKGYFARAWVNFNGTGTVAIRASGNVSSITDNGTGDYTVNFTTAMPDAVYSAVCTGENLIGAVRNSPGVVNYHTYDASSLRILTSSAASAALDFEVVNVAIFR